VPRPAPPELLDLLLRAVPGAVFCAEWVRGRGVDYATAWESAGVEALVGLPPEALLTRPGAFLERVHPDDRERFLAALEAAGERLEERELEYRVQHARSGEWRWVQERIRALPHPEPGRTRVLGLLTDVTELVRQRQRLAASEERMRLLVEGTPYFFFYTQDVEGNVTYVSPSVERITGRTPREWIGQHHWFVTDSPVNDEARRRTDANLRGEPEPGPIRVELRHADGRTVLLEVYEHPIVRDGRVVGLAGIAHDVTERERLAEELAHARKMEAVGRLAAGIAHDINNLLQGIVSAAELVELESREPAVLRWTGQIRRLSDQGRDLVASLLAYSRRQVLSRRVEDLSEIVRQAAAVLGRTLGDRVELRLELAPGPLPVLADPAQLTQVLYNLAANAADAMPDGGVLTIRTATDGDDPDLVVLEVADTGVGIPPEHLDSIFDPFFTTKEIGRGTGLGLASVQGTVAQHGGTIAVASEPGAGTVFTIRLPRARGTERGTGPCGEDGPSRLAGRVLLVEDAEPVRVALAEVLRSFGLEVRTAATVAEAAAAGDGVDLLLADHQLPDGTGLGLLERLRRTQPTLPALLLSGYGRAVLDRDGGTLPEGVELIAKPVTVEELRSALARHLPPPG